MEPCKTLNIPSCGGLMIITVGTKAVVEHVPGGSDNVVVHSPGGNPREYPVGEQASAVADEINREVKLFESKLNVALDGAPNRGEPNRGQLNRGQPNRGEPNRGRND